MVWVVVGLCIATAVSVATIVMALWWERHHRKLTLEKLQEQIKLQEIAHHKAETEAAFGLKIADIKWPRAVK